MNPFLQSTIRLVARHGLDLKYKTIVRVLDEIAGTVVETPTEYTLKIYPKHIQASQYQYPTLVGKQAVMFYLANPPLAFQVKVNDTITYQNEVYKVMSYQTHMALGQVCLYRIIAVKG